MKHWADLHCHTSYSDGSLSPKELVFLAKKRGLYGLSITDHDTIGAYPMAISAAKEIGLHLGSGVEFSCEFEHQSVHILGYDFLLADPGISELCQRHQTRRRHRNYQILDLLRKRGLVIKEEELLVQQEVPSQTLGRPLIAKLMVTKGYVKSIPEAFYQYLGEGKPCYIKGESFSLEETRNVIHHAQGKIFLAHPHLFPEDFPVQKLLEFPFDGVECYYAKIPEKLTKQWVEIAHQKKWIISGGSDFHGRLKPRLSLGCSGIDQHAFHQIFHYSLV